MSSSHFSQLCWFGFLSQGLQELSTRHGPRASSSEPPPWLILFVVEIQVASGCGLTESSEVVSCCTQPAAGGTSGRHLSTVPATHPLTVFSKQNESILQTKRTGLLVRRKLGHPCTI